MPRASVKSVVASVLAWLVIGMVVAQVLSIGVGDPMQRLVNQLIVYPIALLIGLVSGVRAATRRGDGAAPRDPERALRRRTWWIVLAIATVGGAYTYPRYEAIQSMLEAGAPVEFRERATRYLVLCAISIVVALAALAGLVRNREGRPHEAAV